VNPPAALAGLNSNAQIDWAKKRLEPDARVCHNDEEYWDKECPEAIEEGMELHCSLLKEEEDEVKAKGGEEKPCKGRKMVSQTTPFSVPTAKDINEKEQNGDKNSTSSGGDCSGGEGHNLAVIPAVKFVRKEVGDELAGDGPNNVRDEQEGAESETDVRDNEVEKGDYGDIAKLQPGEEEIEDDELDADGETDHEWDQQQNQAGASDFIDFI
jgi:hypothetical protein